MCARSATGSSGNGYHSGNTLQLLACDAQTTYFGSTSCYYPMYDLERAALEYIKQRCAAVSMLRGM
jgi:hypothetical protein